MAICSAYRANSAQIVQKILEIYEPNPPLIADVTHGLGVFWRKESLKQIPFFDKERLVITSDMKRDADVRADFRTLPYRDKTFGAIFLDPPWGNLSTAPRKTGTAERYKLEPISVKDLRALYTEGMEEAARILAPGGFLVIKCQDQVCSGQRHWFSQDIFEHGLTLNLKIVDRMTQIISERDIESDSLDDDAPQVHFRSIDSHWWIMQKPKRKKVNHVTDK